MITKLIAGSIIFVRDLCEDICEEVSKEIEHQDKKTKGENDD
jgi:hypothetical protein